MSTAVILYGLPATMTSEALRGVLTAFAPVQAVQLSSPSQGLLPTVVRHAEVPTPEDAVRLATVLNDVVFWGRSITAYATIPFLHDGGLRRRTMAIAPLDLEASHDAGDAQGALRSRASGSAGIDGG